MRAPILFYAIQFAHDSRTYYLRAESFSRAFSRACKHAERSRASLELVQAVEATSLRDCIETLAR